MNRAGGRRAVRVAEPLPDCASCGTPTRRKTYDANGGLCTPCNPTSPLSLFDAAAREMRNPRDDR